jgi:hypothetical protein
MIRYALSILLVYAACIAGMIWLYMSCLYEPPTSTTPSATTIKLHNDDMARRTWEFNERRSCP